MSRRSSCFLWLAVAFATASFVLGFRPGAHGQTAQSPQISWIKLDGKDAVRVSGVPPEDWSKMRPGDFTTETWQNFFPVIVDSGELVANLAVPPMLGRYQWHGDTIEFIPAYPLAPSLKYRATFYLNKLPKRLGQPALITALYQVNAPVLTPTTIVQQVYPSADVLPENLLKFYLHFSAPMSGGNIYEHIHLLTAEGRAVQLPFLEIDEELWNPDMTRLTLFIDPGRIKRGVKPLEDIGPALETGKSYTLVIDSQWQDGQGAPLKSSFKKAFKVSAPDREAPDPKHWKVTPAKAGSTDALVVQFPKPLDYALAQRMLWVTGTDGKHVAGNVRLTDKERRWEFTPETPWTPGAYQIVIQTTIEDLAGNNIGKPFEVDLFDKVQKRITHETVTLPFMVK
jgi:hypothetical protein